MHKELIICSIVIVVVVGLNIITQNYTNKSVEFMNNKLETLKAELVKEEAEIEKEKVEKQMQDIMEGWKKKYEVLAYFIEHDELEKVETELTCLKADIQVEEYQQGVSDLDKSIFILNHIKEKFRLEVKNIF